MSEIMIPTGTTDTVNNALDGELPVLLWLSNGGTPPLDIRKAINDALKKFQDRMVVYAVDTERETALKERFDVGKHPVLLGWHQGEIISRRSRPWAADVSAIVEKLGAFAPAKQKTDETQTDTKENTVINTPVKVTDTTFQEEVLESDIPVLIDFWAEWCGPCRMVAPTLEKLAGEYAGKVKIAKVNVDENPQLAGAFRIMSIPTLMFVKEGKIVGQSAGAAPEPALRDALEQLIALEMPVS